MKVYLSVPISTRPDGRKSIDLLTNYLEAALRGKLGKDIQITNYSKGVPYDSADPKILGDWVASIRDCDVMAIDHTESLYAPEQDIEKGIAQAFSKKIVYINKKKETDNGKEASKRSRTGRKVSGAKGKDR